MKEYFTKYDKENNKYHITIKSLYHVKTIKRCDGGSEMRKLCNFLYKCLNTTSSLSGVYVLQNVFIPNQNTAATISATAVECKAFFL